MDDPLRTEEDWEVASPGLIKRKGAAGPSDKEMRLDGPSPNAEAAKHFGLGNLETGQTDSDPDTGNQKL